MSYDKIEIINDFYTKILHSLGFSINNDAIEYKYDGRVDQFLIEKKQAVLPTRAIMKVFDGEKMYAWHPLSEHTIRGESALIKRTKRYMVFRMISDLKILTVALMEMAANHDMHKKLNPDQSRFLAIAADADEKTCARFKSFWEATDCDDQDFIRLFLDRSSIVNGVKYPRAALLSFQHLNLLFPDPSDKPQDSILGVPLRKVKPNDLKCWSGVLEYVLPDIRVKNAYSGVSEHGDAPYFVSMMDCYLKFNTRINLVAGQFLSVIPLLSTLIKDLSWGDDLAKISSWMGVIPDLENHTPSLPMNNNTASAAALVERNKAISKLLNEDSDGSVSPAYATTTEPAPQDYSEGVPFVGSANAMRYNNTYVPEPVYQPYGYQNPQEQYMPYNPAPQNHYPQYNGPQGAPLVGYGVPQQQYPGYGGIPSRASRNNR